MDVQIIVIAQSETVHSISIMETSQMKTTPRQSNAVGRGGDVKASWNPRKNHIHSCQEPPRQVARELRQRGRHLSSEMADRSPGHNIGAWHPIHPRVRKLLRPCRVVPTQISMASESWSFQNDCKRNKSDSSYSKRNVVNSCCLLGW